MHLGTWKTSRLRENYKPKLSQRIGKQSVNDLPTDQFQTGAVESHHQRKTGQLVELSPQNLIDCTRNYSNLGCMGGYVDEAFEYIKNNGINAETTYPFQSKEDQCKFDRNAIAANVTGKATKRETSPSNVIGDLFV